MERHPDLFTLYGDSFADRNKLKTELILANSVAVNTMLDIGCNTGYIAESYLLSKKARKVFGIEMEPVIKESLLADPRFKLLGTDVTKYVYKNYFNVVVYASTHHHIFWKHGKNVAFRVFKDAVDHCTQTMFFEMGCLAQGAGYWGDEIAKYFKTDDEHLDALMDTVKGKVEKIEEIGRLPICGYNRPIYKITKVGITAKRK